MTGIYIKCNNGLNWVNLWVRLNYATTHHHSPPAKIYLPPPPTTSQNISTTTSQDISTNTRHDLQTAKTFFIRNPFIRVSSHCLTARQETYIADLPLLRNFFYMAFSIIFTTYTRNGFKKLQCKRTFILCETSLVLKKDK